MGITLDQIVERFEVSRRTAERMLAALRVTFVDLEATFRKTHLGWTNSARARPSPEIDASPPAPAAEPIPSIRNPLAELMAAAERLRADALDLSAAIEQIVQSDSRISAIVDESVSRAHAEQEE